VDDQGSTPGRGWVFVLATVSRPTLARTQPSVEWVAGILTPGVKRAGRKADHTPPSSAEVENGWSYTPAPPIRLHGVVLS
jgi:hypothetical protein